MPKVPPWRTNAASLRSGASPPRAVSRRSIELAHSQNFISDAALVRRLLKYIELRGADTIVEIGPGKGALTSGLARIARRVLAIEADPALALDLIRRLAAAPRVTIVHGDFLDFPLPARPFIVAANIPFNRTAEIVHKLTGEPCGLTAAYLIMQREAAHKFSGEAGGCHSLLSHFIQLEFSVSSLCNIPRTCFAPQPRVDAAFALFRKRKVPLLAGEKARQFKDLLSCLHPRGPLLSDALRCVFTRAQARKLCADLGLKRGLRLNEVAFSDWLAVHNAFREHAAPAAHRKVRGAYARLSREQAGLKKRHRASRM